MLRWVQNLARLRETINSLRILMGRLLGKITFLKIEKEMVGH
jgi:hypothetical protein